MVWVPLMGEILNLCRGLDLATSSAVRSAASAASEHREEMAQVYRAASGGKGLIWVKKWREMMSPDDHYSLQVFQFGFGL